MKGINIGSKNGNWNGGRIVTNRGYVKVLDHGNPRADRDGYVLEHIVVMEKKLRRILSKGEVVHHKNGDKKDNGLRNLLLFSSHSEHLKHHADLRGRKVLQVRCDTCKRTFLKAKCRIKKFNFCCQAHVRPQLWRSEKGG